jgi:predicted amidophosphoribosyltransferase
MSATSLDGTIAVAPYEDRALATLLHQWKYERVQEAERAASEAFAGFVAGHAETLRALARGGPSHESIGGPIHADALCGPLLVPIPMHPLKKATRGFNQAEILARAAAATLGWPVATRLLTRGMGAAAQAEVEDKEERRANVEGLYRMNARLGSNAGAAGGAADNVARAPLAGKNVFLIDDVTTTGATLEACAMVLKAAGAQRVFALTLLHRT